MTINCLCVPPDSIVTGWRKGMWITIICLHSYLGVVAREKIPIVHNSWKDVPDTLKDLVWNDILVSDFNIEYMFVYLILKLNGMQFVKCGWTL